MDNIKVFIECFGKGVRDAGCGVKFLYQLMRGQQSDSGSQKSSKKKKSSHHEEAPVLQRIFQCCALNGIVFLCSIFIFYYAVRPLSRSLIEFICDRGPTANSVWSWVGPGITVVFQAFWVGPVFLISKVINSLWYQDIADAAYRQSGGRHRPFRSMSKMIADFCFSIFVQTLFLAQALLLNLLPVAPLGQILSLFHMCLLYSLYAFEYKWYYMGWELYFRLSFIETNWPYFLGFGFPLAFLIAFEPSFVVSGCIFSILFPLLIISANEAEPMKSANQYPVKLFSPVVWLSNVLFHRTLMSRQQVGKGSSTTASPLRS